MLLGTATFKCKQCGHQFPWLDIEGDLVAGGHLPHCPKCRSGNVRKTERVRIEALKNILGLQ